MPRCRQVAKYDRTGEPFFRSTSRFCLAVPEDADPLHRIESIAEVIGEAHLAIYDLYRAALTLGAPAAEVKPLLNESTTIVFMDTPSAAEPARSLARDAELQSMLQPPTPEAVTALGQAVEQAETALAVLLERQQQIAREMRKRAERS